MSYKLNLGRATPFRLLLPMLGLVALTGCASVPDAPPMLSVPIPASLREPCPRPARPDKPTVGDLAAFSVNQEAAIATCDAKRSALVEIADAYNALSAQVAKQLRPRKWWGW